MIPRGQLQNPLLHAVLRDDVSMVQKLVDDGIDVNVTVTENGETVLFHAVREKKKNMVQALVNAGIDVNASDKNGLTAMYYAVNNKDVTMIQALADAGDNVSPADKNSRTFFYAAVRSNDESTVQAIIRDGVNVNVTGANGETALFYAIFRYYKAVDLQLQDAHESTDEDLMDVLTPCPSDNETMVQVLIDAGADVNIVDKDSRTVLFYAVRYTNSKIVENLLEHGADVNIIYENGRTALFDAVKCEKGERIATQLLEHSANVNHIDSSGQTALFRAVHYNKVNIVRKFIEYGANTNIIDNGGETVLFHALDRLSMTRELVEKGGANVNMRDPYGRTPLFYSTTESTITFDYLMEKGADLNAKDNCNVSVLSYSVDARMLKILFLLPFTLITDPDFLRVKNRIRKSAVFVEIINVVFREIPQVSGFVNGYDRITTCLNIANGYLSNSKVGKKLLISKLLQMLKKSKQRIPNCFIGLIPEVILEVLPKLVELGANPNSADRDGNTALHFATRLPFNSVFVIDICRLLHELGASINIKNHQNKTPLLYCLSWAIEHTYTDVSVLVKVCQFLIDHGSKMEETTSHGKSVLHLFFGILEQSICEEDERTRKDIYEADKLLQALLNAPVTQRAAYVNKRDNHLNSPLHLWAAIKLKFAEQYSRNITEGLSFKALLANILKMFLEKGAQVNVKNEKEETPLHTCKTWSAVEVLLDAGANSSDVDSSGRSPLLVAAKNKTFLDKTDTFYPDVLMQPKTFWRTTIEKSLNPWAVDESGESVLSVLLEAEQFVLAKALVDVADESKILESGAIATSLLIAICRDKSSSSYWKSNLVETILKSTKTAGNIIGNSPLHLCCRNIVESLAKKTNADVHWTITKLLLQYGADCRIPDSQGRTCLDIADACPALKDLLTKPVEVGEVPLFIPWNSVSKTYESKLGKVARQQESIHADSFWYHSEHLQEGSFGLVFAGINEKDGREVAIKRIEKLRMHRPEDKREKTILTELADCEQVVRYLCFFEDEHFSYVVLELMEGNLEEYLSSGSDHSKDIRLCEDIVRGLNFLHDHRILHRDLKPANILYKTHPTLYFKIADFGLSRRIDIFATTVYGTNAGTRCWIAPEVLKSTNDHDKRHDKRTDIFSCGLVLHYSLSVKRHPFAPVSHGKKGIFEIGNETEANILKGRMEGWDDSLCVEGAYLIRKMLDSDPGQRPSTSEALFHPLFWSNKKHIDLLVAVGNQPEFECPRAKKPLPLTAVEKDLETQFGTIVKHGNWNDPNYVHMADIHKEMKKRKSPYDTHSVVELVRFIRNAYAHVSEDKRPVWIRNLLLEDFVFLEYFPNLVMEVFTVITNHGWHISREEIKYVLR